MNKSSEDLDSKSGATGSNRVPCTVEVSPHPPIDQREWIAKTAHGMAERRGFAPGHDLEDWLEAEKQVQFEIIGEGRTF